MKTEKMKRIAEFVKAHGFEAYLNSSGSVTMEIGYFNAPSEWVVVENLREALVELGY